MQRKRIDLPEAQKLTSALLNKKLADLCGKEAVAEMLTTAIQGEVKTADLAEYSQNPIDFDIEREQSSHVDADSCTVRDYLGLIARNHFTFPISSIEGLKGLFAQPHAVIENILAGSYSDYYTAEDTTHYTDLVFALDALADNSQPPPLKAMQAGIGLLQKIVRVLKESHVESAVFGTSAEALEDHIYRERMHDIRNAVLCGYDTCPDYVPAALKEEIKTQFDVQSEFWQQSNTEVRRETQEKLFDLVKQHEPITSEHYKKAAGNFQYYADTADNETKPLLALIPEIQKIAACLTITPDSRGESARLR